MTDMHRPDPWDDVPTLLREQAEHDLTQHGRAGLYLAAADGTDPLFVAVSRPFPKGGYADPIIELVALACPLGADRLAVAVSGRAWSLDDPIVPVSEDGDLRQQVVSMHVVDAHGRASPVRTDVVHPFDLDGGAVRWHAPLDVGPSRGWIPEALEVLLAGRGQVDTSGDVRAQLERCLGLGHEIGLTPEAALRLFPGELADLGLR